MVSIIIGIAMTISAIIGICLGSANIGKPMKIGEFIEGRGLIDDKSKSN